MTATQIDTQTTLAIPVADRARAQPQDQTRPGRIRSVNRLDTSPVSVARTGPVKASVGPVAQVPRISHQSPYLIRAAEGGTPR